MMKKILLKYYPPAINIYTAWILYMMFFAFERGVEKIYEIHTLPFEAIAHVLATPTSRWEIIENIIANVVLFMPYGFLGILYAKLNQYKFLLLAFFIGINYIEFSQYYFNRGFAELDDVIMNVFGMSMGFLIYKKIFR